MALELTKEQEAAVIRLADLEIATKPLKQALKRAEADWADVEARWLAERQAEERRINLAYAEEMEAKRRALADAQALLEAAKGGKSK